MRQIKNECLSSGPVTTSAAERDRGWTRCSGCGKVVKLHKGSGGLVIDRSEHNIPRHSKNV